MKIDEKPFEIKAGCKEPEECTKDFCKNGGICQQDRINLKVQSPSRVLRLPIYHI